MFELKINKYLISGKYLIIGTAMGDEISFVYGGMVGKEEFDSKEAEQSERHNLTTATMNSILEPSLLKRLL